MTDTHLLQAFRVQLSQANDARTVEHDLRVKAERRTAQCRVLLCEMAQRLLPNDLDDLWKTADINGWPDDQFARWLMLKLDQYLFDCRAIRSGRVAEQVAKLQTRLNELLELIQQRDRQIDQLNDQVQEIVGLKDQIGQLRIALAQTRQEKIEQASDLDMNRALVTRLRAQIAARQSPTVSDITLASTATKPSEEPAPLLGAYCADM